MRAREFETYFEKTDGCWLWTGSLNAKGYGRYRSKLAHRVSYEKYVGPIPEKLVVDHKCRVRNCVNPDHLEPVTIAENTARGDHPSGAALRGVCSNGHPFTGDNVRERKHRPGVYECVQCNRDRSKRWRDSHRKHSDSPENQAHLTHSPVMH